MCVSTAGLHQEMGGARGHATPVRVAKANLVARYPPTYAFPWSDADTQTLSRHAKERGKERTWFLNKKQRGEA